MIKKKTYEVIMLCPRLYHVTACDTKQASDIAKALENNLATNSVKPRLPFVLSVEEKA